MQAIVINDYGDPEVLEPADVPQPKLAPDGVLVRAKAAAVNPIDCKMRRGQLAESYDTYFPLILGRDVAGVVESVGHGVSEFAVGDEVVAFVRKDYLQFGTYAEVVSCPVRTLAHRPMSVGFEESAAAPLVALTAYQTLTKSLHVGPDDVVLVNAAAGGVGSMAVQLARLLGARVIGTASEHNDEYLRELGAEPVTYGNGLVSQILSLEPKGVTAAVDLVGGEALEVMPEVMRKGGRLASVIDPVRVRELGGYYVSTRPDPIDLAALVRYIDGRQLRVHVSHVFRLSEAAAAHRLVEQGHVRGKIVLTI